MLTPRKQKFVAVYLKSLNATQSAIAAGYIERTARQAGHRLLTDVDVLALLEEVKPTKIPDANGILQNLEQLRKDCMVKDERGRPIDPATACRALELQGRYHQLWMQADGPQTSVQINILRG